MSHALQPDGTGLIDQDPYLKPHANALRARYGRYRHIRRTFDSAGGLLGQISQGHRYFGFNRGELNGKRGVFYREWAPAAIQLRLIGDFNNWDRMADPLVPDGFGVWSIFLSDEKYGGRLTHESRVKVHVIPPDGMAMDRLPAYIRRVVQDASTTEYAGQYWNPPEAYKFTHPKPVEHPHNPRAGLRVYEAHVGMAQEEGRVGTYLEFAEHVLPRIAKLGYNAVQLMAIQEHPYYGSFGYHVSNFFAPSSRFGTPEELKKLIDVAHGLGIAVLLDIVHSHAVKNTHEGLAYFDGTDYQYFHAGGRGHHSAWDSKLFDYSKYEVQRFLLSNCRYWLEEFNFDGYRFDGVTSMLYLHHGLGAGFSSYDDYFGQSVDPDAVAYLQLANELIHTIRPAAVTVAEDVSGMVGIASPVDAGGIGFDYRLQMGIPDYWIKLLKERSDEQWNLAEVYSTMLNRRWHEKHIAYAESHDQALVGDKTIAFWLMDQEMYWNMARDRQSLVIDRGIALHKLIRLISFSLGGEGYLNFMGNEFGHPEWVDFPREGNGYSYHYCRRQWSLADNAQLRYQGLYAFDRVMLHLDEKFGLLEDKLIEQLWVHEDAKQLVYRRGPLVFVINLHPTESYSNWRVPVPDASDYQIVLNSDDTAFDGFGRVEAEVIYPIAKGDYAGRGQSVSVYVPSRSAQVLAPVGLVRN